MQLGLDKFLSTDPASYGRVGWLATGSAVTAKELMWGPQAALAAGFSLTTLFAPEHGPHGAVKEGQHLGHGSDDLTGLPVYSLYDAGCEGEPDEKLIEAVRGCDTIVIDVLDIGARYSTYIATTKQLVDAASDAGRRVVVLDRPNLLGRQHEGPSLAPGQRSFVGVLPVPIRHGLTTGELMRWYVRTRKKNVELEVVTVTDWDGAPAGLGYAPYLPPSPNLNCIAAQFLYLGTCLIEGTNLSEGRGTANPFQVIGSPWLDATGLIAALRADDWPGATFREVRFVPLAQKHAGSVCRGVFVHVVDPAALRPIELGIRLLSYAFAASSETTLRYREGDNHVRPLDQLWGDADLADYLQKGRSAGRPFSFGQAEGFAEEVEPDLLYET